MERCAVGPVSILPDFSEFKAKQIRFWIREKVSSRMTILKKFWRIELRKRVTFNRLERKKFQIALILSLLEMIIICYRDIIYWMYITKQFNCTSALRLVRERSEFFVAKLWEYGARNLFMRFEQSGSFGMAFDINNSLHLPLRYNDNKEIWEIVSYTESRQVSKKSCCSQAKKRLSCNL